MPYPDRLYRCNINANINGDQMVHTVWMQQDASSVGTRSPRETAEKVRDSWTKYLLGGNNGSVSLAVRYSTGTIFSNVQCYKVDAAGKAVDLGEASFAANVKGTATSALPGQVALCVTLLTGGAGRSRRGRLFLGGFGTSNMLEVNGRVLPAAAATIVDSIGKFYAALRDEAGGDQFRPVVVSPTTGQANKITAVQVGDVFDTMRSRRKSRGETRVGAVVDAT